MNEFHRQEIFNLPLPKGTSVSVHWQLYVIEDVYKSLSDNEKAYLDKMTLDEGIGHGSLLVPAVTQIGGRVNLEVVTTSAKSLLSEIQITPLGNWICI
jgi:hypothetical protein